MTPQDHESSATPLHTSPSEPHESQAQNDSSSPQSEAPMNERPITYPRPTEYITVTPQTQPRYEPIDSSPDVVSQKDDSNQSIGTASSHDTASSYEPAIDKQQATPHGHTSTLSPKQEEGGES